MSDDSFSASQLRQRYQKGGDLRDDELTAAQLRARYGLQANTKNFSTSEYKRNASSSIPITLIIVVTLGIIASLSIYYYFISTRV
jgi:hypothetical protein